MIISYEKLAHFQCDNIDCGLWWSIGDAPGRDYWFCPWCGTKCIVTNQATTQAGTEITTRTIKARIGNTTIRPEFPIVYDEE